MRDQDKSKELLIEELQALRRRLSALEGKAHAASRPVAHFHLLIRLPNAKAGSERLME